MRSGYVDRFLSVASVRLQKSDLGRTPSKLNLQSFLFQSVLLFVESTVTFSRDAAQATSKRREKDSRFLILSFFKGRINGRRKKNETNFFSRLMDEVCHLPRSSLSPSLFYALYLIQLLMTNLTEVAYTILFAYRWANKSFSKVRNSDLRFLLSLLLLLDT